MNITIFRMLFFSAIAIIISCSSDHRCLKGDCKNGEGIIKWNNQAKYEGGFRNGKLHGDGIYTWPDGIVTKGKWKDGVYIGEK